MNAESTPSWLQDLLKPLVPTFREVVLMSLFVNLLALAVPVYVLQVYDRVVFQHGLSTLVALVIGMAGVFAFDFILKQSRARILQRVALRVDVLLGRQLFHKLTSLPLATLEQHPGGYWQALFRDVETVRNTLSGASAVLICDLPFALLFFALVFVIAEPVAWVLLTLLPLFLVAALRSGHVLTAATRVERENALNRETLLTELIAGRGTIKALNLAPAVTSAWEQRHAAAIEQAISRGSRADGYANFATTLTMVATVAMTAVGAIAILEQQLTIGALIAANMLSGRVLAPLSQLVASWRNYGSFADAITRLGQTFAMPSERVHATVASNRPGGRLTVEGVTFTYPNAPHPVVAGVGLSLPPSGLHALVGRNGSGKTTLLKLLQGLYRPEAGRILLDGADIAQFSRDQLARWIGYVPQECVFLTGTIREAIAARLPEASDADVISAATVAGAHAFIVDLPDGYATPVGEAGSRLSTGQRQRLAIARALVGEPPVLLLDEPSSNLDREAEAALLRTLIQLGRNRTIVVVSHAPVLLAAADTVTVLDRGRILRHGPPAEVLARTPGHGADSSPAKAQVVRSVSPSDNEAERQPITAVAPTTSAGTLARMRGTAG